MDADEWHMMSKEQRRRYEDEQTESLMMMMCDAHPRKPDMPDPDWTEEQEREFREQQHDQYGAGPVNPRED